MTAPRRTWLYRFFDAEGVLLYVGIAYVPSLRWPEHRITKWWPLVDRMTAQVCASRAEADRAEAKAIAEERPLYNRVHRVVIPPEPRPSALGWCACWVPNRARVEHGSRLVCRREPGHDGDHRSAGGHEWPSRRQAA